MLLMCRCLWTISKALHMHYKSYTTSMLVVRYLVRCTSTLSSYLFVFFLLTTTLLS
jgi:hypothetical protein